MAIKEEQKRELASCPFKCGMLETNLHFMECLQPQVLQIRRAKINNLRTRMEKYGLHEAIITCILWGLKWHSGKQIPTLPRLLNGAIENQIQLAIEDQASIGWENMRRGFISRRWSEAQQLFEENKKMQPKPWNTTIIKWILEYSWDMWMERIKALHGTNVKENREKRREKLGKEVEYLYLRVSKLPKPHNTDILQLFRMKEENRRKKGIIALESWIKMVTKVVRRAEESIQTLKQTGIDKWLNRIMTYQEVHGCSSVEGDSNKSNKTKP